MRQDVHHSTASTRATFARDGYAVVGNVFDLAAVESLRVAVHRACDQYRSGSDLHRRTGNSIAAYTRRFPERNPGVAPQTVEFEPYLLGTLAALDPRFRTFIASRPLWELAGACLSVESDSVVYHFAQLLRKPAHIGPAMSWHRDYANTYISTNGPYFVRLLVPLQAMSAANGGTGVIPASHLIDDAGALEREAARRRGILEGTKDAVFPNVGPGDVLAIHSKLLHGSGPNRSSSERDVIAVQFGDVDATLLHRHDDEFLSLRDQRGFEADL